MAMKVKKIIRNKVFETNSSSTHTITIYKKEVETKPKLPVNSRNKCYLSQQKVACSDKMEKVGYVYDNEVDKAGYSLNLISGYLFMNKSLVQEDLTFEEYISIKQFVWLKEMLEEETNTEFVFVKPIHKDNCPYFTMAISSYDCINAFKTEDYWEDKTKFKDYFRNLIFNDNMEIEDVDEPWGYEDEED